MATRLELLLVLIALEVHERGEEQDHVATLVHDGRVAVVAADLAGQLVLDGFLASLSVRVRVRMRARVRVHVCALQLYLRRSGRTCAC